MEKKKDNFSYFTVQSPFIMTTKFQKITEQSKRGSIIYDNFCQSLQNYYKSYKTIYDNLYQSVKINQQDKSPYIKQFKQFLSQLTTLIKNISVFQVDCLTQIRAFKETDLQEATDNLVDKISQIKQTQDQFYQKYRNFQKLEEQLKISHSKLQHQSRQPLFFYNQKHILNSKKHIQTLLQKISNQSQQLSKQLKTVTENSKQYELYLNNYKKKLFVNKYRYLTKLIEMSKSSRQCLTQLLVLVCDCIGRKYLKFKQLIKNEIAINQKSKLRKNSKGNQSNDNIACQIITMTQQYCMMIQEISEIINIMIDTLSKIASVGKIQYEKSKDNFIDHMNKVYQISENPSGNVMDSLDLYNYFTQKFAEIGDKLVITSQDLIKLKQNVKKHSDISLSLLKCGSQKTKILHPKPLNTQSPRQHNYLDDLMDQMSFDYVNAIMENVYQSFSNTFSQLKNYFNSKYYKKKKNQIQDSMDISHIEQDQPIFDKKPAKHQQWLWTQWKNTNLSVVQPQNKIKEIKSDLKRIKFIQDQGKLIQKYNCVFTTKKQFKGIMKIFEKQLQIGSSDGNLNLRIALNHIDEVSNKIKIFQKILVLSTQSGQIIISKIMGDIQQVKQTIENQINTVSAQLGSIAPVKRVILKLTQNQQKNMKEWKYKVQSSMDKDFDTFQKVQQHTIHGTTIDHIYEMVISDKSVNIKGKQYPSFYQYIILKNKNFNVTGTQYTPPGPKFYTKNQNVTFENSPTFSTRVVQYDHPIPPIPFMPKSVHVRQQINIYWVSHQQFILCANCTQSGAPYTENFIVKVLYKAKKLENGEINLSIYGKVVNVKDFSMRKLIQAKAKSEMNENCKFTLNEQVKYIKSMVAIQQGKSNKILDALDADKKGQMQKSTEVSQQLQKKQNQQMQKLKLQNKLLVGGFVGLVILNILLSVFFD